MRAAGTPVAAMDDRKARAVAAEIDAQAGNDRDAPREAETHAVDLGVGSPAMP